MEQQLVIAGQRFTVQRPYSAGHILTESEAAALNQMRAENIGNTFRKRVQSAVADGGVTDELRQEISEYDQSYDFSRRAIGAPRQSVSPLDRIVRELARKAIQEYVAKTGRKMNAAPEGQTLEGWKALLKEKTEELYEDPGLQAQAKKILREREKVEAREFSF